MVKIYFASRFNKAEYRWIRAVLFVCLGGFGFVPTFHLIITTGWNQALVIMIE